MIQREEPDLTLLGLSSGRGPIALGTLAKGIQHRHLPIPTRLLYQVWAAFHIPKADSVLGGLDVFHATNYVVPPTRTARRVVTIHDLAFLVIPATCSPRVVGPFSKGMRRFAQQADAVLTYSEATRRDVMTLLEVPPAKITVAPMAVDDGFQPMAREQAAAWVHARFGISPPFLLFVGTLEPRKNVPGLLRGFARAARAIPHNLVLIGSVGWNAEPVFDTIRELGLENRVVRPGFVPHVELPAFYCAADAFVFPTFYEGFGLPLLEALTCGCPVVAANNSSVPEVTGGAALLVEAGDDAALADAMLRLLTDDALRQEMIQRGKAHARRYSWERCAATTLDVYRTLAACS